MNDSASTKARLQKLRDLLLQGLVERDEPVRLALLAAVAGEHLLLLGPPGVAKSEIARRLRGAFRGASWFERLLTKFTVPEELFGPLSIEALKQDRYHRKTQGYLPSASVAFLDEVFKANSAILNALLTLLNEREFDNGVERTRTPLVCVIGASNELPKDEEGMQALYDRFLLRCHVDRVGDAAFGKLLTVDVRAPDVPAELQLTAGDLAAMQAATARVKVPDDVLLLLQELRKHLAEKQIPVTDRRWRKIVGLLRASAFTNGRDTVDVWDCWLVQHCTWNKPEERAVVRDWYEKRVGAAQGADPAHFERLTASHEQKVRSDADDEEVVKNASGEKVYVDMHGQETTKAEGKIRKTNKQGMKLYKDPGDYYGQRTREEFTEDEVRSKLSGRHNAEDAIKKHLETPENWVVVEGRYLPKMRARAFPKLEIEHRLRQIRQHRAALADHIAAMHRRREALNTTIDQHVWIAPGFSAVARPVLDQVIQVLEGLVPRWEKIEKATTKLPQQAETE